VRRIRPLLVVVVAVLLGVGIVVLSGGRLSLGDTASCDIPDSVGGGTESSATGGGIRVVEQGLSQSTVDGSVSVGAVLANTGREVAYRTRVTFELLDATGRPVGAPDRTVVEVPVLLPGQRIGVGSDEHPAAGARVASVRVVPGTTRWVPRDAVGASFTPVTATYLRTVRPDPAAPSTVDVHYTAASANCRPLDEREAAVVFRDGGGAIVGGALVSPGALTVFRDSHGVVIGGERHAPDGGSCDQGRRETWVIPLAPAPAATDAARTRVYAYCDLSAPSYAGRPGEPAN
jgi:hypothetical protein